MSFEIVYFARTNRIHRIICFELTIPDPTVNRETNEKSKSSKKTLQVNKTN